MTGVLRSAIQQFLDSKSTGLDFIFLLIKSKKILNKLLFLLFVVFLSKMREEKLFCKDSYNENQYRARGLRFLLREGF